MPSSPVEPTRTPEAPPALTPAASMPPATASPPLPAPAPGGLPVLAHPPTPGKARLRARLLIAALGAGVLVSLAPYVAGLVGGALLYVMCAPLHRRLRTRLSSGASAALLVLGALLLVLLPGAWLTIQIVQQAPDILRAASTSPLLAKLDALTVAGVDVGAQLARAGGTLAAWGSRQAVALLGGATQALLDLVIALFGLYYLLVSGDALWSRVRRWVPFTEASAERLRDRAHSVAEATLLGTALTAALQGAIVGVAFWLTGIDHALFWGAVTALCSVLPLFGSALVWLPGTLFHVAEGRIPQAVALLVAGGLLASNVDNLIRPIIYRRVSDIHPMVTLVGAFAGVRLFGLVGVLLGPLAISLFFELLTLYEEEYG